MSNSNTNASASADAIGKKPASSNAIKRHETSGAAFSAAAEIDALLSKLSSSDRKDALKIVLALQDQRAIPMGLAVARPAQNAPTVSTVKSASADASTHKQSKSVTSIRKTDPELIALGREHDEIVKKLHASDSTDEKLDLAGKLHENEAKAKSRRVALQGNVSGAGK